MLRKEQIEYALHYVEDPVEWVFELVRGLEKRIDELSKFGTKVTVFQEHWHPASELPSEEGEYIAIDNGMPDVFRVDYLEPFGWCVEVMGAHEVVNVKWWCYPPKEE